MAGSVSYLTMTGSHAGDKQQAGGEQTDVRMGGPFASLLFTYGSGVVYLVCATTVLPKLLTEIFPAQVRALGIGLPNAVTSAVLGGLAPASAAFAAEHDASGWFIAAVTGAVLLAIPASVLSRTALPAPAPAAPGEVREDERNLVPSGG